MIDFDAKAQRLGTGSSKWDSLSAEFGRADLLPMWVADMDFRSPEPVIEALKQRVDHGYFGYTIRTTGLEEAITGWFERRHGWSIHAEWIRYSQGVVNGLGAIVRAFTEPGDKVIVQPPIYPPFFSVVKGQGRIVVENPLQLRDDGTYGIDFNDLEEKAKAGAKLLLLCSPHNPVGRVWSREELMRVGEICLSHNILIVSDEIHCDFVYSPLKFVPFATLSEELAQNSIVCVAPSKTFNLAGFHSACVIIPNKRWRDEFSAELMRSNMPSADVLGTVAMEAAYRHGDEWLDELLLYLQGNVEVLTEFVAGQLPGIQLAKPEGTYLAWLDCRELNFTDKALQAFFVERALVGLNAGTSFGTGGSGHARFNFGCPRAMLLEALHRIGNALKG